MQIKWAFQMRKGVKKSGSANASIAKKWWKCNNGWIGRFITNTIKYIK